MTLLMIFCYDTRVLDSATKHVVQCLVLMLIIRPTIYCSAGEAEVKSSLTNTPL